MSNMAGRMYISDCKVKNLDFLKCDFTSVGLHIRQSTFPEPLPIPLSQSSHGRSAWPWQSRQRTHSPSPPWEGKVRERSKKVKNTEKMWIKCNNVKMRKV